MGIWFLNKNAIISEINRVSKSKIIPIFVAVCRKDLSL